MLDNDGRALASYGVSRDSTVSLVGWLRGAGCVCSHAEVAPDWGEHSQAPLRTAAAPGAAGPSCAGGFRSHVVEDSHTFQAPVIPPWPAC